MAGITLPYLRPQIKARISAPNADTYLTDDIIDNYINEAVQQVCDHPAHQFKAMVDVVFCQEFCDGVRSFHSASGVCELIGGNRSAQPLRQIDLSGVELFELVCIGYVTRA